jgi:hypothetical protein
VCIRLPRGKLHDAHDAVAVVPDSAEDRIAVANPAPINAGGIKPGQAPAIFLAGLAKNPGPEVGPEAFCLRVGGFVAEEVIQYALNHGQFLTSTSDERQEKVTPSTYRHGVYLYAGWPLTHFS